MSSTCFVFDPDIGDGAWTMYRSDYGAIGPVLDGSDINAKYPLAAFWSDQVGGRWSPSTTSTMPTT